MVGFSAIPPGPLMLLTELVGLSYPASLRLIPRSPSISFRKFFDDRSSYTLGVPRTEARVSG